MYGCAMWVLCVCGYLNTGPLLDKRVNKCRAERDARLVRQPAPYRHHQFDYQEVAP